MLHEKIESLPSRSRSQQGLNSSDGDFAPYLHLMNCWNFWVIYSQTVCDGTASNARIACRKSRLISSRFLHRVPVLGSVCPIARQYRSHFTIWNHTLYACALSWVVEGKKLDCCLQGPGHSEASTPLKRNSSWHLLWATEFFLQANFVSWYTIMNQSSLQKVYVAFLKVKVTVRAISSKSHYLFHIFWTELSDCVKPKFGWLCIVVTHDCISVWAILLYKRFWKLSLLST